MNPRVLISAEDIDAKLAEMGKAITADYDGKNLLLVGILKGAFIVMADLARHIHTSVEFDFMAVSSYGGTTKTSGAVSYTHLTLPTKVLVCRSRGSP